MFFTKSSTRIRLTLFTLALFGLSVAAVLFNGFYSSTASAQEGRSAPTRSSRPSATFPGTGTGPIPDGGAGCPQPGAPLSIDYQVSGVSGAPTGISCSITVTHTYVGDISATLYAPDGTSHVIFAQTGAIADPSFGDSSDLGATYVFGDNAPAPPSGGWWQEAAARTAAEIMTAGTYRTTAPGGAGQTNPAPATNMNAAFAGVANPNGTWTLVITDGCAADTGTVTASSLTINAGPAVVQHVTDFNGDGKTDFSVARDQSGTINWYNYDGISVPPAGITYATFGTSATDFITPEDFDGDNKTDVTVWRPGVGATAGFYILQSSNSTVRFEQFGQTNDDPAIVGDYDGDGKADPAVYRCPQLGNPAGQCFFYYRGSFNNPTGSFRSIPWGFGNDGDFFPYLGDFDGDGKNDFCIQRTKPGGGTQGQFVLLRSSDQGVEYLDWGLNSDFLIPGDYDGDGKTDFCVRRTISGFRYYFVVTRTGSFLSRQWGITGDTSAPGDYDGDGKTDFAVWRASTTPGQTAFYVLNSSNDSVRAYQWGQNNDFAVAGWSVH